MKTKTSLIACLTSALLFGTALTVAAIDFPVPDTSGLQKQFDVAQAQKDAANATITANPTTVQIPDSPDIAGSTTLTWKAGNGPSKVQIKRKGDSGIESNAAINQASSGSAKVTVRPGTNVFTLIFLNAPVATVTVKAVKSSSTSGGENAPQTPPSTTTTTTTATITADPRVLHLGKHDEGSTTLTWDAGKGHSAAEVRVRVENHDEKLFAQSAKGTRQVKVKADKTYVYTLSDGGQQLDTVTVKGKK